MYESDVNDWRGYEVIDPDGSKIGTIEDFFVDRTTERPEWALVNMGLLGLKQTLVPFEGSSLEGERLKVPYDKSAVKDAPTLNPGETITEDSLAGLYRHYGLADDAPADAQPSASDVGAGDMAAVGATGVDSGPEPSEPAEREGEIRETQDELRERQADLEGRQDALERREADLEQRVEAIAERETELDERTAGVEDAVPAPGVGRFEGENDLDRDPAVDDRDEAMVGAGAPDTADRQAVAPATGSGSRLRRFGEG